MDQSAIQPIIRHYLPTPAAPIRATEATSFRPRHPARSVNIGPADGLPGGHPGLGAVQAGSGGVERYCIAAYTLTSPDRIAILNGSIRNANPNNGGSTDGVSVKVFVNDNSTPKLSSSTSPGFDSTTSFNVPLGDLIAGDTIYVAMGSNGEDLFDSFQLRYDIVSVPEPSVTSLIAIAAGWGIIVARYSTSTRTSACRWRYRDPERGSRPAKCGLAPVRCQHHHFDQRDNEDWNFVQ